MVMCDAKTKMAPVDSILQEGASIIAIMSTMTIILQHVREEEDCIIVIDFILFAKFRQFLLFA